MWFASSDELKKLSVEGIKQMWNIMRKKKGCPFEAKNMRPGMQKATINGMTHYIFNDHPIAG